MRGLVYTAIMGEYDTLKEPAVITDGWDYRCYTDIEMKSDTWDIRKFECGDVSPVKASKMIKILWRLFERDYDYVIWADASLLISCDLNMFIEKYYTPPLTLMLHPARTCIYKEAEIIKSENIESDEVIDKQTSRYLAEGFPKDYGLTANGVMITDKDLPKEYNNLFIEWWNEVYRGSKRDQMSFMYAMWKHPLEYHTIPYDIIYNEFKFKSHGS